MEGLVELVLQDPAGTEMYTRSLPGLSERGGDVEEGVFVFFFFNDTASTEIYTLSLHDALRSRTNNIY